MATDFTNGAWPAQFASGAWPAQFANGAWPAQFTNGAWPAPDNLRRTMADVEGRMAAGMEQLVAGQGFSQLLGLAAENAVALTTVNAELWDLVWRNLRLAGRADLDRLERRINDVDDKLEAILQEIEALRDRGPAIVDALEDAA
jgi:hypothetical protein